MHYHIIRTSFCIIITVEGGFRTQIEGNNGVLHARTLFLKRSSGSMVHFEYSFAPQRLHVIAMERNGGCIGGRQWGQNYLAAPHLIDPLINKLIMAKWLAYLSRSYRKCQLNYISIRSCDFTIVNLITNY